MPKIAHWRSGLLLTLVSLTVAEIGLRVASGRVPALDRILTPAWLFRPAIPDPDLGLAGNPAWHDHDARGFRNEHAASRADIVTLGDSHTYGGGVASRDAWPVVLGAKTGLATYNMALPGWGPGQAWLVMDQAIALRPRLIVFGLYFGNDFYDVFKLMAGRPELGALVRPSLRDSASTLETQAPIAPRVAYLFELGDTATHQAGGGWRIRLFLSRNSKLYALARAGVDAATGRSSRAPAALARDLDAALRGMTEEQKRFITVYRGPEWSTLLTPEYRDLVLDDRDPRIRIGVEASKDLIVRMDGMARANGIRFLVVLLPTKESVFAAKLEPGERSVSMERLVGDESRVHDELIDWFEAKGIDWLDALPVLRSAPAQPYFPDADGHPNEFGHRLIADVLARRIAGSR